MIVNSTTENNCSDISISFTASNIYTTLYIIVNSTTENDYSDIRISFTV